MVEQVGHAAPPALAVAAPCDLGRQGISLPLGIPLGPMDLAEHVAVPPGLRTALAERDPYLPGIGRFLSHRPAQARAQRYGVTITARLWPTHLLGDPPRLPETGSELLRRERDLNPRGVASQGFSRAPHSAALPSLRCRDLIGAAGRLPPARLQRSKWLRSPLSHSSAARHAALASCRRRSPPGPPAG